MIYETGIDTTGFTHDLNSAQTAPQFYRVSLLNLCNEEGPLSDPHASVHLEVDSLNLANELRWNKYLGENLGIMEVQRSVNGGIYQSLLAYNGTDTFFTDRQVRCGNTYRYRILSATQGFAKNSYSNAVERVGIDTIPTPAPELLRGSILSDNSVIIWVQGDSLAPNRDKYELFIGASRNQLIKVTDSTMLRPSEVIIGYSDTLTMNAPQWVSALSIDSCGNVSDTSNWHRLVYLEIEEGSNQNTLRWTPFIGWNNIEYVVKRKKPNQNNWLDLDTLAGSTLQFIDSRHVNCDTAYEYIIACYNLDNGLGSASNTVKVIGQDTIIPAAPNLNRISINNWRAEDDVEVLVELESYPDPDDIQEIQVSFIYNGGFEIASRLDPRSTTLRQDFSNFDGSPIQVRIRVVDSCGNHSEWTSTHSSISLTTSSREQSIELSWNEYDRWKDNVDYEVYRDGNRIAVLSTTNFIDSPLTCTDEPVYEIVAIEKTLGF